METARGLVGYLGLGLVFLALMVFWTWVGRRLGISERTEPLEESLSRPIHVPSGDSILGSCSIVLTLLSLLGLYAIYANVKW